MTPQELLDIGPGQDEELKAALFTTFEPADRSILADRLLPALLGQLPAPAQESQDFARARAQLCNALSSLRGKIVVVSSCGNDQGAPWLSHYVRFRRTFETQHAKLWMLHWQKRSGAERLELVVSSANLTEGGIDRQIQGAWRASVALGAPSKNISSWADLPSFLAQLGISIGPDDEIAQFANLLYRAKCPKGVHFVANGPGNLGNRGTASLKAGLGRLRFKPAQVRVVSPYIGAWTRDSVRTWLNDSGALNARKLELAAVEVGSVVPERTQWILPEQTRNRLWDGPTASNVLAVGFGLLSNQITKEMRGGASAADDRRWTHAKLYEFSLGRQSTLLVTSANFTPTAWASDGSGNFELGVLLEGGALPFRSAPANDRETVQCRGEAMMDGAGLWGSASWDGTHITVFVRDRPGIDVVLACPGPQRICKADDLRKIVVAHRTSPPATALIKNNKSSTHIPIVDVRQSPVDLLPMAELSEESALAWRDWLLLAPYGIAPEPEDREKGTKAKSGPASEGDYSVPILMEARLHFEYIDGWQEIFDSGKSHHQVCADAPKLLALLKRRSAGSGETARVIAAVAEEFSLRLRLAGLVNEKK